jgi:hypothetical protein
VKTVIEELKSDPRGMTRVVFCCFSEESARHVVDAFAGLGVA